jgi:transcriptional regulator with XRE-family HTH domain
MPRKTEEQTEINNKIGRRLHEMRLVQGMSRQQVADKVSVTHQQLHKYENGANRISAARLYELAEVFKKPVEFFFEKKEGEIPDEHRRLCIEVSRNLMKIKSAKTRLAISKLVTSLVRGEGE